MLHFQMLYYPFVLALQLKTIQHSSLLYNLLKTKEAL